MRLKRAIDDLALDGVDRRSVEEMVARPHRATPELLVEYLSEAQVMEVCEFVGIAPRGCRAALVAALLDGGRRKGDATTPAAPRQVRRPNDGNGDTQWSRPNLVVMNEESPFERGLRNPSLTSIQKLARALEVSMAEMVGEVE